jgi:metallo-beta-lactamase family protein
MNLQFLGGAGTVTGSKYLVSTARSRVMVDCGLFQGLKQLRLRNWAAPPVEPASIDAVVLTHAHLDHSGYLPLLVRRGFRGPIYCTEATLELCRLLLPDSGHLLEEDAAYLNRHRLSRHDPALPLYTQEDAERALKQFAAQPWDREFRTAEFSASFRPAGHLLGAAVVEIEHSGRRIVFSGDLGRSTDPVLMPPASMEGADCLLVESTYGDRRHPATDPLDSLERVITTTVGRGGSVIVPAFAVGRTQTLLYLLHLLKKSGRMPASVPIYVDSPMAASATRIYARFRAEHRLSADECVAAFDSAISVNSVAASRELDRRPWPMVLIAASGMATGGRVLHHLKLLAPNPRHTILLTGFQAAGTRGAALAAGARVLRIHGQDVPVNARVEMLENLSAHADYEEILRWLTGFAVPPRMTFIVHGEPTAADAMRRHIQDRFRWACRVPDHGESVEIE